MKISELHEFFEKNWSDIVNHLSESSMVIVQRDKIISIE